MPDYLCSLGASPSFHLINQNEFIDDPAGGGGYNYSAPLLSLSPDFYGWGEVHYPNLAGAGIRSAPVAEDGDSDRAET